MTLLGAPTSDQSGPGSDGNEGVLHIPQSSSITGTSLSDCLVSYQDIRYPTTTTSRCILLPPLTTQQLRLCADVSHICDEHKALFKEYSTKKSSNEYE